MSGLFAHPGHWAAQLLYLAPVAAMIGALLWARHRGVPEPEESAEESGVVVEEQAGAREF